MPTWSGRFDLPIPEIGDSAVAQLKIKPLKANPRIDVILTVSGQLYRKFKIALSGCKQNACALVSLHDLGGIAAIRDGKRGFELYVGGGLGAVPHQAKLLMEFCPEEDVMPVARAIGRVFAKLGEKKNRQKARLKFVVAKLGIDEFRKVVEEERRTMPEDPSWRKYFSSWTVTV